MINIILEATPAEKMAEIFAQCPVAPLMPPLGDSAWRRAGDNPGLKPLIAEIRSYAFKELDVPMLPLPDALYGESHKSGNRQPFESRYFGRRAQLGRAVAAALVEKDPRMRDRFVRSALVKMEDVFSETSWAIPACIPKVPTGIDPMAIDLGAAETANVFGELLNLLGQAIPQELQARVKDRLRRQFFENFLANKFWWMAMTHNWNAVCHQGVLGAALAVCDDPQLLGALCHRAAANLKLFLSGFTPSGGCSEGVVYWGYGFGRFAELNAQLERRTHGRLSLFEGDARIGAIARFGPRMTLSHGESVNFADCSPTGKTGSMRAGLVQYLADRMDDPYLAAHAAMAWSLAMENPINAERHDLFFFTRQLLRAPAVVEQAPKLPDDDLFLDDLGVAVSRFHDLRGNLWEWAAKGGHNEEHHNHNDVGSYLLDINGVRLLTETGAPEYDMKYFQMWTRYESIAARSLGHPVPLINGHEQPGFRKFQTPVLISEFDAGHVRLSFDIAAAYAPEAGCARYVRTFQIDKNAGRLSITDEINLAKVDMLETALITESPVTLVDGRAMIQNGPVTIRVTAAEGTAIVEVQQYEVINIARVLLHVNRIVLRPENLSDRVTMACVVEVV